MITHLDSCSFFTITSGPWLVDLYIYNSLEFGISQSGTHLRSSVHSFGFGLPHTWQGTGTMTARDHERNGGETWSNVGVSKNSGTPKSSILIGFSIINHPFWGTTISRNIHVSINPNAFLKCITRLMKKNNICGKTTCGSRSCFFYFFVWHPPLAERALKKCGVFFSSKVPSFHGGAFYLKRY